MVTKLSASQFSQEYGHSIFRRILIMRDRNAHFEVSLVSLRGIYFTAVRGLVYPFVELYKSESIEEAYEAYKVCRKNGGAFYA